MTVNELNSWGSKLNVGGKTVTIGSVNDYSGSEFAFTGQEGVTVKSGINNKNSTIIEAKTGDVSIVGYLNVNYDGDVSKLNTEKDENDQPKLRGGVMNMTAQNGSFQMSGAGSVYAGGESTVTIDSGEVKGIKSVKSEKGSKLTITDRNTSDLTFNSLSAVKGHLDISGNSITVNSAPSIYNSDIKLHAKNDIDIKSAFVTGHEDETNSWNFYDYAYQKWMGTTSLTSDEGSVKIEGGNIQSYGKDTTFSISANKDVNIAGEVGAINEGKITIDSGNKVDIGASVRANGNGTIEINAKELIVAGTVDSQANGGKGGPSHITITADDAHIKNTLNLEGGSEIAIHGKNAAIAEDTYYSLNLANNTHLLIDSTGTIVIGKEGNTYNAISAEGSTFNIGSSTSELTINGGVHVTNGKSDSNTYDHLSTIDGKTITINRIQDTASAIHDSNVRIGSLKDQSVVTINKMTLEQHSSNVTIDGKTITLTGMKEFDRFAIDSGTNSTTSIGSDGTETVSITGRISSYGNSNVYIKGDTITLDNGDKTAVEIAESSGVYVGDEKTKSTTVHGTLNNRSGNTDRDGQEARGIHVDGQNISIDQGQVLYGPQSDGIALAATNGPITVGSQVTEETSITGNLMGYAGKITVKGSDISITGSEKNQYAAVTSAGREGFSWGGNIAIGDEKTDKVNIKGGLDAKSATIDVMGRDITLDRAISDTVVKQPLAALARGSAIHMGSSEGTDNVTIQGSVLANGKEVTVLGKNITLKKSIYDSNGPYHDMAGMAQGGNLTLGDDNTESANITGNLFADGKQVVVNADTISMSGNTDELVYYSNEHNDQLKPTFALISHTGATIGRDNATAIDITGNILERGSEVKILGGTDHLNITGSNTEYTAKAYDGLIQIGSEETGKTSITQGGVAELGGQIDVKGKDITLTGNDVQLGEYPSTVYKTKQKMAAYAQGGTINIGLDSTEKALLTGNVMTLGGNINVLGKDVKVNGDSSDYAVYEQGGKIQIGSESTAKAEVNGGVRGNGSTVTVQGENVTLTQGSQENAAHSIGANITVGIDGKTKADVTGTLHAEGGEVNVLGKELTLTPGKTEKLANAKKGGKVTIGSASSTKTVMEGNLSTDERSQVEAWLNTNASVYIGTLDDKQILNDDAGVTLQLNDGGTWKETGHSNISKVLGKGGVIDLTNGKLNDSVAANVYEADGGIVSMDIDGSNGKTGDYMAAGTHSGTTGIKINPTSVDIDNAKGKVLALSVKERGSYKPANPEVESPLFWKKWTIDKRKAQDGDAETFKDSLKALGDISAENVDWYWFIDTISNMDPKTHPTTGVQTGYSADSLIYNTWRTENDKLLQRMGELRHGGSGQAGLWARIKGNEIHRDGIFGFKNKYNVYELGYDRVNRDDESGKKFTGFTFRYIDGDSRFEKGTGSNNAYGAAFYMTNMRPAGHYLDFIVRYDYFKTDYDVYNSYGNKIHGDPDANGLSASLEYGRKKQIDTKGWYVEPQTQLTMGYLHMKDYATSDGVHMEGDNVKSAVWRGGFNLGREFHMNDGRKGNAYLKANWYHEFGGAIGMDMSEGGERIHLSEGQNDTWFEYGIGATFQLDAGTHIYFDYERGVGSDYKKDWTWDFGVRFEY